MTAKREIVLMLGAPNEYCLNADIASTFSHWRYATHDVEFRCGRELVRSERCESKGPTRADTYEQIWGGWIRTNAWRSQSPLPYRLATPHRNARAGELQGRPAPPSAPAQPRDLKPLPVRRPTTIPERGDQPYDQEHEVDREGEDIERDNRRRVGDDGAQKKGPEDRGGGYRECGPTEPARLVHLPAIPGRRSLARRDAIEERNRPREIG